MKSEKDFKIVFIGWGSFDAAVWTALGTNYKEQQHGQEFSIEHAAYLDQLPKSPRDKAIEYFEKAPEEVMTPLRRNLIALKKLLVRYPP